MITKYMNQVDILKNVLKNEGLRYTQQRQIIWDEIRSSTEHRDAEEIYLIIKKKNKINVSRATVYRTIDVLVKNNLVRKMELGDGRALYEHKADDEHHDHIICLETGKIIEFYKRSGRTNVVFKIMVTFSYKIFIFSKFFKN